MKFLSTAIFCLLFYHLATAQNPVQILCAQGGPNNSVVVHWVNDHGCDASFSSYKIFRSTNEDGPFTLIGTLSDSNANNFVDATVTAPVGELFYFVELECSGSFLDSQIVNNFDPLPPLIESISVVNGEVLITWKAADVPDSFSTDIFRFIAGGPQLLSDVTFLNSNQAIDSSSFPSDHVETYDIATADGCGNLGSLSGLPHSTMLLNEEDQDHCDGELSFLWSGYQGWNDLNEYRLLRNGSMIGTIAPTSLTPLNTNYMLSENDNSSTCFVIEAVNTEGTTSLSNEICYDFTEGSEYFNECGQQNIDCSVIGCAAPVVPSEICPAFCDLTAPYTIEEASTTFNCSLSINSTCLTYTSLPGIPVGAQDRITITACTANGSCQTVEVEVMISDSCDEPSNNPIEECELSYCTTPITPIYLCPDFFNLTSPWTIDTASTQFNSPVVPIDSCVVYTPLPGLDSIGQDEVMITACNADGLCQTIEVAVTIVQSCDENFDCGDLCSLEWFDSNLLATHEVAIRIYNDSPHIFLWPKDPYLADGMSSLFDCAGNNICNFGGIDGLTGEGCPGFSMNAVFPWPCAPSVNFCFNECLVNPTGGCGAVFEPVCGCDGNTYSNSCVAEVSGIIEWTSGECESCEYPLLNPDNYTLFENQDSCLYVRYNDNLLQDIGLIYSLVNQPTSGTVLEYNLMEGCFIYEATPGFSGSATFQYEVCYLDFPCNGQANTCSTETVMLEVLADTANTIAQIPFEILKIYPNPTQTKIHFDNTDGLLEVAEILSIEGKLVERISALQPGLNGIDVAHLASGLYFLNAFGSKRRFSGRFEKTQ